MSGTLLTESGDRLLLENGDTLLLEHRLPGGHGAAITALAATATATVAARHTSTAALAGPVGTATAGVDAT